MFPFLNDIVKRLDDQDPMLRTCYDGMRKNGAAIALDFSQKNGVDYLVLTSHFVNDEWALRHFVLAALPFDVKKTAENVDAFVTELLLEKGFSSDDFFQGTILHCSTLTG
jgi:hypothetical protein